MKFKFNKKLIALLIQTSVVISLVIFWPILTGPKANADEKYIYLICDVYDVTYNGNDVEINIILPNKELLTRHMSVEDDLPEEFTEVAIEPNDLDDYSTYEIVGMR